MTALAAVGRYGDRSMTYPKLSIQDFGTHLLLSGDLDPVYLMLNRARLPEQSLARWLLVYWCTYNVGVASYVTEQASGEAPERFWQLLYTVADNTPGTSPLGSDRRWPRGKERRHWRGQQAKDSCNGLQARYYEAPEQFVIDLKAIPQHGREFTRVAKFVEGHRGFGPWMAFKIADMLEQVLGEKVDFNNASVFMFKDPKEAALRYWRRAQGLPEGAKPRDPEAIISAVANHLVDHFQLAKWFAPNGQRLVSLPEIETILCKWKSHDKGHYPLNNDIGELHHALDEWQGVSKLAKMLKEIAPNV